MVMIDSGVMDAIKAMTNVTLGLGYQEDPSATSFHAQAPQTCGLASRIVARRDSLLAAAQVAPPPDVYIQPRL